MFQHHSLHCFWKMVRWCCLSISVGSVIVRRCPILCHDLLYGGSLTRQNECWQLNTVTSVANITMIKVAPVCTQSYSSQAWAQLTILSRVFLPQCSFGTFSCDLHFVNDGNLFPSSFYRSITATLASRLVLNLRGSLLCPAYNTEIMTTELTIGF